MLFHTPVQGGPGQAQGLRRLGNIELVSLQGLLDQGELGTVEIEIVRPHPERRVPSRMIQRRHDGVDEAV